MQFYRYCLRHHHQHWHSCLLHDHHFDHQCNTAGDGINCSLDTMGCTSTYILMGIVIDCSASKAVNHCLDIGIGISSTPRPDWHQRRGRHSSPTSDDQTNPPIHSIGFWDATQFHDIIFQSNNILHAYSLRKSTCVSSMRKLSASVARLITLSLCGAHNNPIAYPCYHLPILYLPLQSNSYGIRPLDWSSEGT